MAFNKMFVVLPVMLAARKIDGDDPNVVYWLRVAYGTVQLVCVLVVVYTYIQASAVAGLPASRGTIYVPPPPTPFDAAGGKKKYQEVDFGAHVLSTARSLLGSTLFGICLTVGLHWYKGMIIGLAIQTVMGPLNLLENALAKALLLGDGIAMQHKIFDEKAASELTADDEIVDESGNPVARQIGDNARSAPENSGPVTFEDTLLDTWDAGTKADLASLLSAINKKNCNYRTKESGWTPLMILAGLSATKGVTSAIRHVREMGGNPAITDAEGWNALHWAAFHGSVEGAREIMAKDDNNVLMSAKDKDGKTPVDLAQAEGNTDVVKLLENAIAASTASSGSKDGLRKRK